VQLLQKLPNLLVLAGSSISVEVSDASLSGAPSRKKTMAALGSELKGLDCK
jgi:hypothetical protein